MLRTFHAQLIPATSLDEKKLSLLQEKGLLKNIVDQSSLYQAPYDQWIAKNEKPDMILSNWPLCPMDAKENKITSVIALGHKSDSSTLFLAWYTDNDTDSVLITQLLEEHQVKETQWFYTRDLHQLEEELGLSHCALPQEIISLYQKKSQPSESESVYSTLLPLFAQEKQRNIARTYTLAPDSSSSSPVIPTKAGTHL